MSEPLISQIKQYACNFAPRTWAYCEGQIMSISENTALYSLMGTYFGGDGRSTFGLPDLRGRFPIGSGTGPGLNNRYIGQFGGAEYSYLNSYTLPDHTHPASAGVSVSSGTLNGTPNSTAAVKCNNSSVTANAPAGKVWGSNRNYDIYADDVGADDEMHAGVVQVTVDLTSVTANIDTTFDSINIDNAGGGQMHNNMSPFQAVPYCIALYGVFPSRN